MTKKIDTLDSQFAPTTPSYWRSLEDLQGVPEFAAAQDAEKTTYPEEPEHTGVNRRKFLGLMGASMALAGLTASGCIRKPEQKILPYAVRPEEIVPGMPIHYATALNLGRQVLGVVVESQEGRPTKVEGNDKHPMSLGATHVWAQASVLDLYDPDRSKKPASGGKTTTWHAFFKVLTTELSTIKTKQGAGLSLLIDERPSPTYHAVLSDLKKKYPKARIFRYDPLSCENHTRGLRMVGLDRHQPVYNLEKADVVLSLESDFLGGEGDSVLYARQFAGRRSNNGSMNRLYAVEPGFSVTGAAADHRLRMLGSHVGDFLTLVVAELLAKKLVVAPSSLDAAVSNTLIQRAEAFKKKQADTYKRWQAWLSVLVEDLAQHKGRSAIMVGERQGARVHALAHLANTLLGNVGKDACVRFFQKSDEVEAESLSDLAAAIQGGAVDLLLILGGNPVYTAPSDIDFGRLLQRVSVSVHTSTHLDETSQLTTWHVPSNHYLESWGDLRATDGTLSIQQPLIAPLYDTLSELELVAFLAHEEAETGHQLVQSHWQQQLAAKEDFAQKWRNWLHDGVGQNTRAEHEDPKFVWKNLVVAWSDTPVSPDPSQFEINFVFDYKLLDGRYANNGWLQELPDPMTKITWDNAAYISPKTARDRKLQNGHFVTIQHKGKNLDIPVFQAPGLADGVIVLPLGYGRAAAGRVASLNRGFNTYAIRTAESPFIAQGATIQIHWQKKRYKFATTQEHGRLEDPITGRKRVSILRETTLATLQKDPKVIEKLDVVDAHHIKSLWKEPNNQSGQQWGMVIDLSRCTGCSVCTIACQAENNIAIVGKKEILNGREMHWIRLDRYYTGPADDPQAVLQPIACVHCENAPCEAVCPVAATAHSTDGMNDMAYNRCIGTRYCANNCPYKVRRFNFYNYTRENDELLPTLSMQRNPDVTVRFRGVMEKCSYCVQRVNQARIEAKAHQDGVIQDGAVTPACAQACPSQAIVFGDISNPNSSVAKLQKDPRNYAVLGELNIKPRTTFLAKLRNPHPKLG